MKILILEKRPLYPLDAGGQIRSAKMFEELSKEKDRIEIIVLFLALLELVKVGVIAPIQQEHFGKIMVSK